MTQAVVAGALVVAALNVVTFAIGALLWWRSTLQGERAVRGFWLALRIGQGAALLFAIAVGVLAAAGREPTEGLFYLYALLPLAIAFVAEQLRVASAQTILDQRGLEGSSAVAELGEHEQRLLVSAIMRREIGVMALSALVVAVLAVRAATTAHGF